MLFANNTKIFMNKNFRDYLLDSSLIIEAKNKIIYNTKIIKCGNYVQVYKFEKKQLKKFGTKNTELNLIKKENTTKVQDKTIEKRNINRTKLECQRLAKSNSDEWKTFITLTFSENVTDIKEANKKFRIFINSIKRIEKNFKYIAIPEFQSRGAVHYHLLTNIKDDDERFIYCQSDNINFKHIKYWHEGFTKVDDVEKNCKKIIGYISKYMTKDIDNRLFNCRRYFYSRNLVKPKTILIDSFNLKHQQKYISILSSKKVIYENVYLNNYSKENILFQEYL